jgi:hypothetical protein
MLESIQIFLKNKIDRAGSRSFDRSSIDLFFHDPYPIRSGSRSDRIGQPSLYCTKNPYRKLNVFSGISNFLSLVCVKGHFVFRQNSHKYSETLEFHQIEIESKRNQPTRKLGKISLYLKY